MGIYLFFAFLVTGAFAQHSEQPVKESTQDLRSNNLLFSIADVKKNISYTLQRTSNLEHYLVRIDGKEEKLQKIDSREASRLETDFASRFLKCQYELPSSTGDCVVTLRLNMKGDAQDLCQKDENKTREFSPVFEELKKRF